MKKTFRIVSWLEGISYLLLLFIATPIKYLAGIDSFVKLLGMPHGLLFIGYVILAIMLKYELEWKSKTFFTVFRYVIKFPLKIYQRRAEVGCHKPFKSNGFVYKDFQSYDVFLISEY